MPKFYITTSIAYVNAPPHLGYALELLQADVIARYRRQSGEEVFFLTGTDEHGAKIARAAEEAGKTPQVLADENSSKFYALKQALNLSWDNFIRTSDQAIHWPLARELWERLASGGHLYKKIYRGLYCVGHEAFITQKDLVDGQCRDHKAKPEILEEENWFFKLSQYAEEVESKINNDELRIIPESRKNEALALLAEDVEDASFSRPANDLSWGIPVPDDSAQTIYVWADALSNYISGYGGIKKWQEHPADAHFIGKDILRFHAIIWPAMLLAAELPLPKSIFVHGHILADGEKMSKSLGNVIDPFELIRKYGADAIRYYLLREIPSSEDGDFSFQKFEERYDGDLANGLGNFTARVLTLGGQLGKIKTTKEIEPLVLKKIDSAEKLSRQKIGEFKFNEALMAIWGLIQFGDQYINEKKPWEKSQSEETRAQTILNLAAILENVAALISPFLPETSEKIADCVIHFPGEALQIKNTGILFPRIGK